MFTVSVAILLLFKQVHQLLKPFGKMKFFEEISKKLMNQDSKGSDGHQNNQTTQQAMEFDENSSNKMAKIDENSTNKMASTNPSTPTVKTVSFAEFRQGFETQTKKNHETLTGLFPSVDPDFLFGKAVEFDGKEDEMNHFIQNVFDRDLERTFPSRADREKRLKLVEENIEELAKLDMLEIQKAGIEGLEYWYVFEFFFRIIAIFKIVMERT